MSKKTKKADTIIDDVKYKQIQYTNSNDTWWKSIPQNPPGVIGSGLHIIDKNRENSHWDIYDGNRKIGMREFKEGKPRFRSMIINLKKGGIFPAPSENHTVVLRGSDKPMGWISLKHYKENKRKYRVEFGSEDSPDVVIEKVD